VNYFENEDLIDPLKHDARYQGLDKFSPIPLSVSSPKINPVDKGKVRAVAFETMQLQAEQQIMMLKTQADLLIAQAKAIHERLEVSRKIYEADLNFEPVVNTIYHVYEKKGKTILSLVGSAEWGSRMPYDRHICSARLMADKSWEVINP
jgi:hypothetical protein